MTILNAYIAGTLTQCGQFPLFDLSLTPAFAAELEMFSAHLVRAPNARKRYFSVAVTSWQYVLRVYA